MIRDPYKYFRIEAREIVEQLSQRVLELEKGVPPRDVMPSLLRLAHTLKGAARVVKELEIAEMTHSLEDELALDRDSETPLTSERVTSLLASIDAIAARVASLASPPAEAERTARASTDGADEALLTLRPDKQAVEALLVNVTEARARTEELRRHLAAAERAQHLASLLVHQLDVERRSASASSGQTLARGMAEELRSVVSQLARSWRSPVEQLDRELAQVRESAEQLQLVPASALFGALQRSALDAAHGQKRSIRFTAEGGDVRLDSQVLAAVLPALVQLVRNAVAHGIEPAAERARVGKAADGLVAIEVSRRAGKVTFGCRDDGRGIDMDAVQRAAVARGLLPAGGRRPTSATLVELLLKGGISTSPGVTEVAGRGVGLDVVGEVARKLGGRVEVQTAPAQGTSVSVVLPASVALIDALVVEAGGNVVALPLGAARQAFHRSEAELLREGARDAIVQGGNVVPLVPLARVLGRRIDAAVPEAATGVVVSGPTAAAAVAVDRIVGVQQIVVRPLPKLAPALPIVSGAWLDVHGNPQLVLDPDRLVAAAERLPPVDRPNEASPPPLLVIDDSLTTRILEQTILESAGFEVDLAVSGEEGLDKARERRYGAFLVDVEMPGMDGYTFVEHTRADPMLRSVPAILVTSRGSPEDKARGFDAGAAAYIVKSEFDQTELVTTVRRLVGLA